MAVALKEHARWHQPVAETGLRPVDLPALCQHLEDRLLRGQEHIRAARARGEDVAHLELRWRDLLRAYERLSQLLARRPFPS